MSEESKKSSVLTEDLDELGEFLDVQFKLSVEFGRRKMCLREILELSTGSIVSIPKSAGDNVDVYANDKLIALGEIITVEETIGIVITEILSK